MPISWPYGCFYPCQQSFAGIEQGVSNTNYNIRAGGGRYVLTLFEPHRVRTQDISFFLEYADHLSRCGIPCPGPVRNKAGEITGILAGRPAAIVPFLEGRAISFSGLTPDDCYEAGRMAARMHKAGASFPLEQPNRFGREKLHQWVTELGKKLDDIRPGLYDFAREELAWQDRHWPRDLPGGAVHGDFFPDNVFFDDAGQICAVLDFHFACTDFFAYDLAIAVNAWCFSESGAVRFEEARYEALMKGYEEERPLSPGEKSFMPVLLRGPALRTSLARCEEFLNHKPDNLMTPHDPHAYLKRLEFFQHENR